MPFLTPQFFKRRNSIDWAPPYSFEDAKPRDWKNKLRKRAPFRFAERNIATPDLSKAMGNKFSSIDSLSRPQRPPRPSVTELPDLPSLPIYQAFTAKHNPVTFLEDDGKPPIPEKSASRRSSVSISGWPLADRGRASERATAPPSRKYASSADAATRHSTLRYDRASYLAESYRSLLPNMDSDYVAPPHPQTWPSDRREPWLQQELHHLGNRSINGTSQPLPTRVPDIAHPWASPPRPRPPSVASSSSNTAVEQDNHSPTFSDGGSITPTCTGGACRRCGLDTDCLQGLGPPDRWPRFHDAHPGGQVYGPPPPKRTSPPRRQRTGDDVGLQICAEMLTDELRTTFLHGKAFSKLQILLLIEAYEATLDRCRKEVMTPPLTRGGEAEGLRRKHVREAVRILDHWLDSLYTMYDEEFGDHGVI